MQESRSTVIARLARLQATRPKGSDPLGWGLDWQMRVLDELLAATITLVAKS